MAGCSFHGCALGASPASACCRPILKDKKRWTAEKKKAAKSKAKKKAAGSKVSEDLAKKAGTGVVTDTGSDSDDMCVVDELKIVRHNQKKNGDVTFTVWFDDDQMTTAAAPPSVYSDSHATVLNHVSKHKELAAPVLKQLREHKPKPDEEWKFDGDDDLEKLAKEHEVAEKAKAEQEEAARLQAEVSVFG